MDVVRSTTVESSMSIEHRGEPVLNAQSRQAAPQLESSRQAATRLESSRQAALRLESSRSAQSRPVPRRAGGNGAGSPVAYPHPWLMLPVVMMGMLVGGLDILEMYVGCRALSR